MQVIQDLHLCSNGSDSENPEEPHQDPPANEDLLPVADMTRIESRTNLPKTPTPGLVAPAPQPGVDPCTGENATPTQEDDVESTLVQLVTPAVQLGIPDPAAATMPIPLTLSRGD